VLRRGCVGGSRGPFRPTSASQPELKPLTVMVVVPVWWLLLPISTFGLGSALVGGRGDGDSAVGAWLPTRGFR